MTDRSRSAVMRTAAPEAVTAVSSIASVLLLIPYMIHSWGVDRYGVWVLSSAVIGLFSIVNPGWSQVIIGKLAVSRISDRRGNEVLNTAVICGSIRGLILLFLCVIVGPRFNNLFHLVGPNRLEFVSVLEIGAVAHCLAAVISSFEVALQMVPEIAYLNGVRAAAGLLNFAGAAILLRSGSGLTGVAAFSLALEALRGMAILYGVKRAAPGYSLSVLPRGAMLLEYVRTSVLLDGLNAGSLVLQHGPLVAIGWQLPVAFAGYFSVAMRLAGVVSAEWFPIWSFSKTLFARRSDETALNLLIYLSRYSLMVVMPIYILVWLYGSQFTGLWMPEGGEYVAAILGIILVARMFIPMQYAYASWLIGEVSPVWQAALPWLEAVGVCFALATVASQHTYRFTAGVIAAGMIAAAATFLRVLTLKARIRFTWFTSSIYVRPLLAAAPILGIGAWLRTVITGSTWAELALAGLFLTALYYLLVLAVAVPAEHKTFLRSRWRRGRFDLVDEEILP